MVEHLRNARATPNERFEVAARDAALLHRESNRLDRRHALLRGERLQAGEVFTGLECEEIQQPARRRHERVLQITDRKVTTSALAVKVSDSL